MRQVLAIASREFVERKLVIAAGAILAVLTLFTPLLPGASGFTKGDVIGIASAWLAVMILLVGALVLGMTSINGDLTEQRLGFYFAKPMSGLTIWMGKVIGALAVVIVTALIAFLPSVVSGFSSLRGLDGFAWVLLCGAILGLFFFGHVAACVARVRSIWILLDFVGLFVLVTGGAAIVRTFANLMPIRQGDALLETVLPGSFFVAIVLAAVASAAGVAVGRVEPARVHRVTSLVLWSLVGTALFVAAGFAAWCVSATPRDLRNTMEYVDVHDGEWLVVGGRARGGLVQEFALRPDGTHLRVGSNYGLEVSDTRLVAIAPKSPFQFRTTHPGRMPDGTVVFADVDHGRLEWTTTKIDVDGRLAWNLAAALSKHGTRLALPTESGVAIYSLPDETLVRAVAIEHERDQGLRRMYFLGESRLRIHSTRSLPGGDTAARSMYATEIAEVDVASGSVRRLLTFQASNFAIDPAGRTVFAYAGGVGRLFDVESGSEIGSLESGVTAYAVKWLSGDRLAIPDRAEGGGRMLRVVSREGLEVLRVALPGYDSLRLGHEPRRGFLTGVASELAEPNPCEGDLLEIDLEKGITRTIARGFAPVREGQLHLPVGSANARTFLGCGSFVRYDGSLTVSEAVLE